MELKTFFAQDTSGNILPGATVTVYQAGTLTPATGLQNETGTSLSNPFNATSGGKVAFYAPDGLYDVLVVSGGSSVTIRQQFADVAGRASLGANTFTGAQTLPGNASNPLEAVPKQQLDSAVGQATETARGTVEIATQAEADAGTDDLAAMTAKKTQTAKIKQGGTVATTSETSVTITNSIPSWAKRVTIQLLGVSYANTASPVIRLNGETSGYVGSVGAQNNASVTANLHSSGFLINTASGAGSSVHNGQVILTNVSGNTWVASGIIGQSDSVRLAYFAGSKSLSAALTTITITSTEGNVPLDNGSVGVMWE